MPTTPTTLRLLMPQWQGGNGAAYPLGARLLAWLAPETDTPLLEVPVAPFTAPSTTLENGIVERHALLRQLRSARRLIDAHQPDRVVVFGGDCLVEQAPVSYLNERYDGELGMLWIDAHPDITTPAHFAHAHAMVLGNLLGEGDPEFAAEVRRPLKASQVMFAGLQETTGQETAMIDRLGLRHAGPGDLTANSAPVLGWIRDGGITHLSIHLDLDVLDPTLFRSQLFANPVQPPADPIDAPHGSMKLDEVARLVADVAAVTTVVGLGIAEHMPWEAINLQRMISRFPLL